MFFINTKAKSQDAEDASAGSQQSLHGWSVRMGVYADEYERISTTRSEQRASLQPLPPSTAAGFVC